MCVHEYLGVLCFCGCRDWLEGRGGGGAGRVGIRRGLVGRLDITNVNAVLAVLI